MQFELYEGYLPFRQRYWGKKTLSIILGTRYLFSLKIEVKSPNPECNSIWRWSVALSDGTVVKNPPENAGDARDMGSIPGWGRSPGERNDNPLQYSCLKMPWTERPGKL